MTGPGWLASVAAVCRHEWRLYLATPLTALFVSAFSVTLAAAIFLVADFYATNDASVRLFRTFLPWVALVLTPALAMRAWLHEPGERGLDLTFSLALPPSAVVGGKFLAGLAVLALALCATAAFPATLFYLGSPDPGVLALGYAGAFMYLAVAFAISLLAAAVARDAVSAFLLGLGALALATLAGWSVLARLAEGTPAAGVVAALVAASPKYWLDRLAEGYVEPAAAAYFLTAPLGALFVTLLVLRARRHSGARPWLVAGGAGLLALTLGLAATRALDRVPGGWDVTADARFTLDAATKSVLDTVPEGTTITLYWSQSEPGTPVSIRNYARLVHSRLALVARAAGSRLDLVEIDPQPESEAELAALNVGIQRVPMTSGAYFYLGVTVRQGERVGVLPYADPSRARLLDYDLARLLQPIGASRQPLVGVIGPTVPPEGAETGIPGLGIIEEIGSSYDLAVIPHVATDLPEGLDVLLMLNTAILRTDMLEAVDAFVRRGGGLLVLLDPHMRSHPPSNQVHPDPSEELNDISDLLLRRGIRYLGDSVVGDPESATPVRGADEAQIAYPYWLRLGPDRLTGDHPVTAGLQDILLAEPGALEIAPGSDAAPLLVTGPGSGDRPRADFPPTDPGYLAATFAPGSGSRILGAYSPPRADGAGPVFAVADADWIFDAYSVQEMPSGGETLRRPLNDNGALLLNMIDFASGSDALIAMRSRPRGDHPFTRVERMMASSAAVYREREAELAAQIGQVEATFAAVLDEAGVAGPEELPAPLRDRIADMRRDLLPLQRDLRDIRFAMREEAVALGRRLTAINLASGPLIVLSLLWAIRVLRRMRGE